MHKNTLKTKYDVFRAEIIKQLVLETGFTPSFIRMAISGDRQSESAETIRKEYNKRYSELQNALKATRRDFYRN